MTCSGIPVLFVVVFDVLFCLFIVRYSQESLVVPCRHQCSLVKNVNLSRTTISVSCREMKAHVTPRSLYVSPILVVNPRCLHLDSGQTELKRLEVKKIDSSPYDHGDKILTLLIFCVHSFDFHKPCMIHNLFTNESNMY